MSKRLFFHIDKHLHKVVREYYVLDLTPEEENAIKHSAHPEHKAEKIAQAAFWETLDLSPYLVEEGEQTMQYPDELMLTSKVKYFWQES